ncbi:MAG: CAP domain-containing protein [Acidobacteriota bacterium]
MPAKQTRKKPATVPLKRRVHKRVKLAVVPHKANQFRPHAVRRYGIAIIVAFVLLAQGLYNGVTSGNILGTEAQVTTAGLLAATNSARVEQGEKPLANNAQLAEAARLKVHNMFDEQYWAHTAPDGTTPWHWFGQAGYAYADAGENLAKNFTTSDSTIAAWLASPTHRANVLKSEYKDVGFAVMSGMLGDKPTTLIVALYGAPDQATVRGAAHSETVSGIDMSLSIMARIGLGLQALTPAAISSIVVLAIAANIALVAHIYRSKLPLALRRSWYRHHGLYKAVGFVSLAIIIVFAYGGVGQI